MSGDASLNDDGVLAKVEGVAAGSRVAGYLVEEQIGRGGMAVVFLARDQRLGRRVALKVLVPALAADDAFRWRFIQESRAAAAADDPHIIPIFEAGEANGVLFIAMRYVDGGDVRTLVRRDGPLSASRAAAILSPVASALDAAHARGLVHRDVNPANMLVDVQPGRPDHVYLSDFGLSKDALSSAGLTITGQFLGTPDYMSPEQIAGRAVDGRADQYALACAAYELLSGAPPFQRDHGMAVIYAHMSEPPPSLASARPGMPAAVDVVLTRALAKMPADRYPSCRDFAESLRAALHLQPYDAERETFSTDHTATDPAWPAASPAPAEPPTTWVGAAVPAPRNAGNAPPAGLMRAGVDRPAAWPSRPRRRPRLAALVAAGVVLLIGGGAGLAALLAHPPPPLAPAPGFLEDVAAISASSTWAVGSRCAHGCFDPTVADRRLIFRRNESGWSRASPGPRRQAVLRGVSVGQDGGAWAAGYSCASRCGTASAAYRTLILRWDGTGWSQVASPTPDQNAVLHGVSAGPGGSAWAVGYSSAPAVAQTLILRWNGTSWSPVASPSPGQNAVLRGVSAGPGGSAWAVGNSCTSACGTASGVRQTLILHWNGIRWSHVASPSPGRNSALYAVSTGPDGSAWAAGYSCVSGCGTMSAIDQTLILHWNGIRWSHVASPSPGQSSALYGVSAGPGGIAWAAGTSCTLGCGTPSAAVHRTLILRWHGTGWSRVASPSPGRIAKLYGVSAGPGGTAWAAGYSCGSGCGTPSEVDRTLIVRWDGSAWMPG